MPSKVIITHFQGRKEVFAKVGYLKIDLSDAHLQIKVDDEHSKLLKIKRERGIYKNHSFIFLDKGRSSNFSAVNRYDALWN